MSGTFWPLERLRMSRFVVAPVVAALLVALLMPSGVLAVRGDIATGVNGRAAAGRAGVARLAILVRAIRFRSA